MRKQAKCPIDKNYGKQAKCPIDKNYGKQAKCPIDKKWTSLTALAPEAALNMRSLVDSSTSVSHVLRLSLLARCREMPLVLQFLRNVVSLNTRKRAVAQHSRGLSVLAGLAVEQGKPYLMPSLAGRPRNVCSPPHIWRIEEDEMSTMAERVEALRAYFRSGATRPIAWRQAQLLALRSLLEENEKELAQALFEDLGKSEVEAWVSETGFLLNELKHALRSLPQWMRPQKVSTPLTAQPGKSRVLSEPKGVIAIIGPWNYPVQLVLAPAIAAIAAGNCAMLKPSELAPQSAALIAKLLPRYLDPKAFDVVLGGIPESTELLEARFDHIFFTGGTGVGRIVMQAAARHLTPVTLELGGKSPAIVLENAQLEVTARRLVWGKFLNAGQTCVAPDYVLVASALHDSLLDAMTQELQRMLGDPKQSRDYGRIISHRHCARLEGLLEGLELVCGGEVDCEKRYFAPTIARNVSPDAPVMQEEIFGPILPVLRIDSDEQAVDFVNARPHPLALYVFSEDGKRARRLVEQCPSGGACINDVILHLGVLELPFGGIGESGMGAYHGKRGFDELSHQRGLLQRSTSFDTKLRYPPYDENSLRWLKRLL
ncbi:MAG: aldehyde dehydrogenase family protein [Myxococcota bacterium]|jgi:aldehyde dehydrogenase (NAD+)|nr:aldehyde dehydrogenase family protein [Myxococcota bacterium]